VEELFTCLIALLHGQAAEFMVAMIQLAVASLKVIAGVCAVLAAALTLAAARAARRQHTHLGRQEKRLRGQQRRRNRAARAHRSASVRDSTPADSDQVRQSRPQPKPLEYGADHLEGEL
jgi:membrane protein implicated in regulation of membrane protease activity